MTDYVTIEEADLKRFAPKAKKEYVQALLTNLYQLRTAGILDSEHRLCHFMAQCAHETGGFTIVRESLHYTTMAQLKKTWPSRFRNKTDAELAPLLKNGRALGDAVYGGRKDLGNTQPGDGFDYRGGGFLQTTGRGAVTKYAASLNLTPSPHLLDDVSTTLAFACLEWQQSKCNACADENDLTKVSKAINTGSASSNVKPVNMEGRQAWFAKAWSIWGHEGRPDKPARVFSLGEIMAKIGLPVAGGSVGATQLVPAVPQMLPDALTNIGAWKGIAMQVAQLPIEVRSIGFGGAVSLALCLLIVSIEKLRGQS